MRPKIYTKNTVKLLKICIFALLLFPLNSYSELPSFKLCSNLYDYVNTYANDYQPSETANDYQPNETLSYLPPEYYNYGYDDDEDDIAAVQQMMNRRRANPNNPGNYGSTKITHCVELPNVLPCLFIAGRIGCRLLRCSDLRLSSFFFKEKFVAHRYHMGPSFCLGVGVKTFNNNSFKCVLEVDYTIYNRAKFSSYWEPNIDYRHKMLIESQRIMLNCKLKCCFLLLGFGCGVCYNKAGLKRIDLFTGAVETFSYKNTKNFATTGSIGIMETISNYCSTTLTFEFTYRYSHLGEFVTSAGPRDQNLERYKGHIRSHEVLAGLAVGF